MFLLYVLNVWLDEYSQRVRAFQTASIARDLNGDWLLFGDALRTVRLPVSDILPEISADVVGYSDRDTDRYMAPWPPVPIIRIVA